MSRLQANDWQIVVQFPAGARDFSLLQSVQTSLLFIEWIMGPLCLGIKQPGCEANHLSLRNLKGKNALSYTSTVLYASMVCAGKTCGFSTVHRSALNVVYIATHQSRSIISALATMF
jgi:hypothetical protein